MFKYNRKIISHMFLWITRDPNSHNVLSLENVELISNYNNIV